MAFKLGEPPYKTTAPIHEVEMEEGVLGKADRNGNILINKNIKNPKQREEVIAHEDYHINDIKMGILDYDDKYVYYWILTDYFKAQENSILTEKYSSKKVYKQTDCKRFRTSAKIKGWKD